MRLGEVALEGLGVRGERQMAQIEGDGPRQGLGVGREGRQGVEVQSGRQAKDQESVGAAVGGDVPRSDLPLGGGDAQTRLLEELAGGADAPVFPTLQETTREGPLAAAGLDAALNEEDTHGAVVTGARLEDGDHWQGVAVDPVLAVLAETRPRRLRGIGVAAGVAESKGQG